MSMSYGVSIALDEYDDFKYDPTTNRFVLSEGIQNCVQAIRMILKILKGELRFYPDFGLDIPQLLDKRVVDNNIKHAISSAIIKDPRVGAVNEVRLERSDRTLKIYVDITTKKGTSFEYREDLSW